MTDNDFTSFTPEITAFPHKRYTSDNQTGFLPFTKKLKLNFDVPFTCVGLWEEVEMKELDSYSQAEDIGLFDLSTMNTSMDLECHISSSRTNKKQFSVPKPLQLNSEFMTKSKTLEENKVLYSRSSSLKDSQHTSCNSWDSSKPHKTVPQPFNLRTESRGSIKEQKLQDKLHALQEIDSLSREFRAKPMPSYSRFLAPNPVISATQPLTFNLKTDNRNKENCNPNEQFSTNFKAKPMPNFDKLYLPLVSEKQLTIPCDLNLHSDRRALKRRAFEEQLHSRHLERAQSEEAVHNRRREVEHENLKIFRKTLDFHARAMPNPSHFEVFRSNKRLTIPVSPKLGPKRQVL